MRTLLIALGFALATGSAHAQDFRRGNFANGNYLHDACTRARGAAAANYVAAISDSHDHFVGTGSLSPRFCSPKEVPADQMTDVVCKYLADNPQDRHYTAASLVVKALEAAFPCRRN